MDYSHWIESRSSIVAEDGLFGNEKVIDHAGGRREQPVVHKFQLGSVKSVNIFCFLFFGDVYESGFEITPEKKAENKQLSHRDITDSCRFRPWPKTRLLSAFPRSCFSNQPNVLQCILINGRVLLLTGRTYHKIRPLQQIHLDHSAHCRKAAKSLKQANSETGRSKQADR